MWRSDHPLDLERSTARFRRFGLDRANVIDAGAYHRVAGSTAGPVPYRAMQRDDGAIEVGAADDAAAEIALGDLRHRLAETLAPAPLASLAARDPVVAALVLRYPGYRPPLVVDPFEALVTAITAQQVNLRWATTTRSRLVERYGTAHRVGATTVWEFPNPEAIAAATLDDLRALQFTRRKAEYLVGLARAATAGALDGLAGLPSAAVIERVTRLRGIGRWSADWLLARCLARPGAVAAGDLAVQKAVARHYLHRDGKVPADEVRRVAAHWGEAANWTVHLLLERLADAAAEPRE